MVQYKLRVYSDCDLALICEISFERITQHDAKENIWEVIIHQKDKSIYTEGKTYYTELLRKTIGGYILVSGSPSINFASATIRSSNNNLSTRTRFPIHSNDY